MQASLTRAKSGGHAREPRLEDGCTVHISLMRRYGSVLLALLATASLAASAVVNAQRKPTHKEKVRIARVVDLPARCARVRVSTVTKKPKWGSVSFRPGPSQCDQFASNGVTVVRKVVGHWRFVTAGSSFDCPGLYAKVPKAVAHDLKISCI